MDNDKNYTVYVHIFPDQKVYVGITKQPINKRWQNGNGYKKQPIYEAIKFYGWEHIKHVVIKDNISKQEAQSLEKELIEKYNSINYGYNVSQGGGTGGNPWCIFEYNNKQYTAEELAQLSPLDNITGHDITNRINEHGWDINKALNHPKQKRDGLYLYNGKEYTLRELFEIRKNKELTYRQICSRIFRHGWDIEKALTQPNNVKTQPKGQGERIYEYKGQKYNSYELSLLSPIKGLTPFDITNRINHHGWDIEKTIFTPKKERGIKFYYNNNEYNSHTLADICIDKTMTYHDVTDRYRNGWSAEEIVNIPKGQTRKQYYNNV